MNMRNKCYCTFVELERMYDKVNRFNLWKGLDKLGTEYWLLNAIKCVMKVNPVSE